MRLSAKANCQRLVEVIEPPRIAKVCPLGNQIPFRVLNCRFVRLLPCGRPMILMIRRTAHEAAAFGRSTGPRHPIRVGLVGRQLLRRAPVTSQNPDGDGGPERPRLRKTLDMQQ